MLLYWEKKPNNIETISKFRVNYYKHAFTISLSYFEQSSNGRIQRALSTSIRRSVEKRKNILTSNRRRNFDCTRWGQSTMLSLLYYAKILKSVKSTLLMWKHPMIGKFTLLSHLYSEKKSNARKVLIVVIFVFTKILIVLRTDIQCQESVHYYHYCIEQRHPMSGKSILLSLLYCAQTSNVRKIYFSITFVLWTDIQCQESLHYYYYYYMYYYYYYYYYHYCIAHLHSMTGKSTLLSLLYCVKTSNVRKVFSQ